MMVENTETEKKKAKTPQERVALKPEAHQRLSQWIAQLEQVFQGIKIKKADLVSWLIMSRPDNLTSRDLKQLKAEYFDEIQFMEWALKKMKEAKMNKQDLALGDLMPEKTPPIISGIKGRGAKKKKISDKDSLIKQWDCAERQSVAAEPGCTTK